MRFSRLPYLITMHITRQVLQETFHVPADHLHDALLHHGVGDVDGEDNRRHVGLHRVSAVVLGSHALVRPKTQLGTLVVIQPIAVVIQMGEVFLGNFRSCLLKTQHKKCQTAFKTGR